MKPSQRKFAVFDIDGTLIRWQLFHAIVHQLGKHGHIPAAVHQAIHHARMDWKNRNSNDGFRAYEQVLVRAYIDALTDISPSAYAVIVDEVFDEYKDQTFVYTRDLIRSLKQQGYVLFAISGSQQDIVQKLAAHHGFDDAIGAHLVQHNGHFTGDIVSPVHDKPTALKQLIQKHHVAQTGSIGVGDSEGDISMLAMVEQAIAFNPSRGLLEHAQTAGWKIVVERKNVVYELEAKDGSYLLAATGP